MTRHSEISCARFWSVIVHISISKLKIPVTEGCIIAAIPIFHTLNFIVSDPTNFTFVGSLLEAMLNCIPIDNKLINKYRKTPASGPRPLTPQMQKALEEANKPKKGGRWKPKDGPSKLAQTSQKKVKQAARIFSSRWRSFRFSNHFWCSKIRASPAWN